MIKIKDFKKARQMLIKACNGYIQHNQSELNKLLPKSLWYKAYVYFEQTLGKEKPNPGFTDWISCAYSRLLDDIIRLFNGNGSDIYSHYEPLEPSFPFKWWNTSQRDPDKWDQTDPAVVLHNLKSISELLNYYIKECMPNLEKEKVFFNYQEYNFSKISELTISVQITKNIEHLRLSASFLEKAIVESKSFRKWLADNNHEFLISRSSIYCRALYSYSYDKEDQKMLIDLSKSFRRTLDAVFASDFEGYLKGVAVNELKSTLENPNLNDKAAIKQVETQLRNGVVLELLQKNRQSDLEKGLKLLSVITILIGVGVFPTLFLACKRLYDSGGTSINFFKPLSKNLCETMESVTEDFHDQKGIYAL